MKRKILTFAITFCLMFSCVFALSACKEEEVECNVTITLSGGGENVSITERAVTLTADEPSKDITVYIAKGYDHETITAKFNNQLLTGQYYYDDGTPIVDEPNYSMDRCIVYTVTKPEKLKKATLEIDATNLKLGTVSHTLDSETLKVVSGYAVAKNYIKYSTFLNELSDKTANFYEIPQSGVIETPYGIPFFLLSTDRYLFFKIQDCNNADTSFTTIAATMAGSLYTVDDKYVYSMTNINIDTNGSIITKLDNTIDISPYYSFTGQSYYYFNNCVTIVAPKNEIVTDSYREVEEIGFVDIPDNADYNYTVQKTDDLQVVIEKQDYKQNSDILTQLYMYVGDKNNASADETVPNGNTDLDYLIKYFPKTVYLQLKNSTIADNIKFYLTNNKITEELKVVSSSDGKKFIMVNRETALKFCATEDNKFTGEAWLISELEENYNPQNDNLVAFEAKVMNKGYETILQPYSFNGTEKEFIEMNELNAKTFYFNKTLLTTNSVKFNPTGILGNDIDMSFATAFTVVVRDSAGSIVHTFETADITNNSLKELEITNSQGAVVWGNLNHSRYTFEISFEARIDNTPHSTKVSLPQNIDFYYSYDANADWTLLTSAETLDITTFVPIYFYAADKTTNQSVSLKFIVKSQSDSNKVIVNNSNYYQDLLEVFKSVNDKNVYYFVITSNNLNSGETLTIEASVI